MSDAEDYRDARLTRRSFLASAGAALVGLTVESGIAGRQPRAQTYEFVNGLWFDGRKFRKKRFYSQGRTLTAGKLARVDRRFDLEGKYVVPPFGDAHNHYLSGPYNLDAVVRQYLKDGIFYVKNPANIQRDTNQIKSRLNRPETVDALFANGGITATGGHPVELYEKGGILNKVKKPGADGTFENLAYFIIDNESDLKSKWPLIAADRPDFLKTDLLYSEEYEKRRDDPSYLGLKGLKPSLLALIVARAHENNLAVACHIETATDFRNALAAGVDEIAHMPGYFPDFSRRANPAWFSIAEQDAELAARKRVVVATTTYVSTAELKKPDDLRRAREIQSHNLRLLMGAGVRLAIGPDVYGVTALAEAMNLYELKVFDNLTLLKMWCETTPQTIFPRRKIGHLEEGYEASFLVLSGDPLQDFTNVRRIEMRVKQGELLSV